MNRENIERWQHAHVFGQDQKKQGESRTLSVIILTSAMMVLVPRRPASENTRTSCNFRCHAFAMRLPCVCHAFAVRLPYVSLSLSLP